MLDRHKISYGIEWKLEMKQMESAQDDQEWWTTQRFVRNFFPSIILNDF